MASNLSYNEQYLQDAMMNDPYVISQLKALAQAKINKSSEPSRYSVVELKDDRGRTVVSIVDNNPDAIYHESQTGDLAKMRMES